MIYAKKINGIIERFTKLPYSFKGIENVTCYYEKRTDLHEKDGFLELVYPVLKDGKCYGEVKDASLSKDKTKYIMPLIDKEIIELDEFSLKDERNQKLREGIEVYGIWFNEDYLTRFISMSQAKQMIGEDSMEWKVGSDFEKINVPSESSMIIKEALDYFSNIYKEYNKK